MSRPGHHLPRGLHPGAWWLWALGLAVAASRTTNPVLLAGVIAMACLVVMARRPDAPWAMAFRLYLYLGAFVVLIRVLFRLAFNGNGPTVLFTLPAIPLPDWLAGIQLLGPISAEALLSGLYDGMRLATMIVCIGAANALANPKRLLAAVPGALYEIGTVVVVSLSVFPQLAESIGRVRRARSLRAGPRKGRGLLRGIVIPVLADALDRSLLLAAAMDSRGYGRHAGVPRHTRRWSSMLLLAGVLGVAVGIYGLLDGTTPPYLGGPMLAAGVLLAIVGLGWAGRRVRRTRYRPDRWRAPELMVAACGVVTAALLLASSRFDASSLFPSLYPIRFPTVGVLPLIALLVAALPAVLAPPPPDTVVGKPTAPETPHAVGDLAATGGHR